ncbi:MAG: DinB family protein [Lautropia sp.]
MDRLAHLRLLAEYNGWMNRKLVAAARRLAPAELALDRGAFFGSILGTLNHLVVGDTIWLKRFAAHPAGFASLDPVRALPAPGALNARVFDSLEPLAAHRALLDDAILAWTGELVDADLDHPLRYANTRGVTSTRSFYALAVHFFNHQTHHRGQATALLNQAGVDVGVTDLLALIPDLEPTER